MHETLCSREEMSKAEDMGDFYRVPADFRDLNYTKYVGTFGKTFVSDEYNSSNTERLDVAGMKKLLLSLEYVQNELKAM